MVSGQHLRTILADADRVKAMIEAEAAMEVVRQKLATAWNVTPKDHPARALIESLQRHAYADLPSRPTGGDRDGSAWNVAYTLPILTGTDASLMVPEERR